MSIPLVLLCVRALVCQGTSCVSPLDEDECGEHRVAEDEEEHFEQPVPFVIQLSGQNLKEGDKQEGSGGESLQHHRHHAARQRLS